MVRLVKRTSFIKIVMLNVPWLSFPLLWRINTPKILISHNQIWSFSWLRFATVVHNIQILPDSAKTKQQQHYASIQRFQRRKKKSKQNKTKWNNINFDGRDLFWISILCLQFYPINSTSIIHLYFLHISTFCLSFKNTFVSTIPF